VPSFPSSSSTPLTGTAFGPDFLGAAEGVAFSVLAGFFDSGFIFGASSMMSSSSSSSWMILRPFRGLLVAGSSSSSSSSSTGLDLEPFAFAELFSSGVERDRFLLSASTPTCKPCASRFLVTHVLYSPLSGSAFSLVLASLALVRLDFVESLSFSFSALVVLPEDFVEKDSFVCCGAGFEPFGFPKNLLYSSITLAKLARTMIDCLGLESTGVQIRAFYAPQSGL
jgi:hypothetical protein